MSEEKFKCPEIDVLIKLAFQICRKARTIEPATWREFITCFDGKNQVAEGFFELARAGGEITMTLKITKHPDWVNGIGDELRQRKG